jgi:hypothetical protein
MTAEAERIKLHHVAASLTNAATLPQTVRDAAADVLIDGVDLAATEQATLALLLAAEAAEHATKTAAQHAAAAAREAAGAADRVRAALAAYMTETGLCEVHSAHHTASMAAAPRAVVVTDMAALPARYLRQREPEADKAALRAALLAGDAIPGATLNNGAMALRITKRKGIAA